MAIVIGVFILLTLAVARTSRLISVDRIFQPLRRWAVNKYTEDALISYWLHCPWCTSIWFAFPAAIIWAVVTLPLAWWWLAVPAWLTMSHLTGLLNGLEKQ